MLKGFESKPRSRRQPLFLIEEEDVYSDLAEKKGSTLFLGRHEENVIVPIRGFPTKMAMDEHYFL